MSDKYTEGKIRDWEPTLEDAARLAECLNSFDDSDSWPGGFTRGNPFTAERVLEDWGKRKNIRVIVAYSWDKIVGHCNLAYGEMDPEASYVGLLGVNPAFQGQGFGKAMLIAAAETAAAHGKRRVDLHTWGGNLKAMPLYKRTGYNWVPGTRVLMESYISGILMAPMFKEFFERHYWYDALKREIKQEIDDHTEEGVGVFKYHFEGENGDVLDILVDREVKGICSFSMTLDGKTVSASVLPEKHSGYIGIGEVRAKVLVKNQTEDDLEYSVDIEPNGHFKVRPESSLSGSVETGNEQTIPLSFSIGSGAHPLDREMNADEKTETHAKFALRLGDSSIELYSGLIPKESVKLSTVPSNITLGVGEQKTVGIVIKNNTESKITGKVVFDSHDGRLLSEGSVSYEMESNEEQEIPVEILSKQEDKNKLISIDVTVYIQRDGTEYIANKRELEIPVFGVQGALCFEGIDNFHVIETESFRIKINKTPPMFVRLVENKVTGLSSPSWSAFYIKLGYPFPSGGSEWERKKFDVKHNNTAEYAELVMSAESEDYPGLMVSIIFRAHAGQGHLEFMTQYHNRGDMKLDNLGVRTGGWLERYASVLYVPLQDSIYRLSSIEWDGQRQLPEKAKYYTEEWVALCHNNDLFGFVWEKERLEEVSIRRSWEAPTLEYRLPQLEPGQAFEQKLMEIIIGEGSWRTIRNSWAGLRGVSIDEKEPIEYRSDLEIELVPMSARTSMRDVTTMFVDQSTEHKYELHVRVVHETPISGEVTLKMPNDVLVDGKDELKFEYENLSIEKPLRRTLTISALKSKDWFAKGGEIVFQSGNRTERKPLTAILYDSGVSIERTDGTEEGTEFHELSACDTSIMVSADYHASLARYSPIGSESMFYDTFPHVKPMVWWDKHYSGLSPIILGRGVWDWETALYQEKWSIKKADAFPWVGYELQCVLEKSPRISGMTVSVRYLLLPGTSLLYCDIRASNTSPVWKEIYIGLRGVPRLGGSKQSNVYSISDGQHTLFEPTDFGTTFMITPPTNWLSLVEPESGSVLGVITTSRARNNLKLANLGADAQYLTCADWCFLRPDEEAGISMYLISVKDYRDVELLEGLPRVPFG